MSVYYNSSMWWSDLGIKGEWLKCFHKYHLQEDHHPGFRHEHDADHSVNVHESCVNQVLSKSPSLLLVLKYFEWHCSQNETKRESLAQKPK